MNILMATENSFVYTWTVQKLIVAKRLVKHLKLVNKWNTY